MVQEVVCVALFTDFIVIFVCGDLFLLFWLLLCSVFSLGQP